MKLLSGSYFNFSVLLNLNRSCLKFIWLCKLGYNIAKLQRIQLCQARLRQKCGFPGEFFSSWNPFLCCFTWLINGSHSVVILTEETSSECQMKFILLQSTGGNDNHQHFTEQQWHKAKKFSVLSQISRNVLFQCFVVWLGKHLIATFSLTPMAF